MNALNEIAVYQPPITTLARAYMKRRFYTLCFQKAGKIIWKACALVSVINDMNACLSRSKDTFPGEP
jgi:hypothetical protein